MVLQKLAQVLPNEGEHHVIDKPHVGHRAFDIQKRTASDASGFGERCHRDVLRPKVPSRGLRF